MAVPRDQSAKDANLAVRILNHFKVNRNAWWTIDGIEDVLSNLPDGSSVSTVLNALRRAAITEQTETKSGRSRMDQPAYEHRLTPLGQDLAAVGDTHIIIKVLHAATQANNKGKRMKSKDEDYVRERERCDQRTEAMVREAVDAAITTYLLGDNE